MEAYSPDNSVAYPGVIITTGDGVNPVYPVSVDLSKISGTATSLSDIRIYDETDNLCFDGTVNTTKITMPKWDGNEADPFTFTSSSFELFRIEKTRCQIMLFLPVQQRRVDYHQDMSRLRKG